MSAGIFEDVVYEASQGDGTRRFPVQVQEETPIAVIGGVANNGSVDSATEIVSAKVSGGRREIGMHCAMVRLKWTGAVPDGYDDNRRAVVTIPMLNAEFRSACGASGAAGTYLGLPVKVVGTTAETNR